MIWIWNVSHGLMLWLAPQLLNYSGSSGNFERVDLAGGSVALVGAGGGAWLLEALLSLITFTSALFLVGLWCELLCSSVPSPTRGIEPSRARAKRNPLFHLVSPNIIFLLLILEFHIMHLNCTHFPGLPCSPSFWPTKVRTNSWGCPLISTYVSWQTHVHSCTHIHTHAHVLEHTILVQGWVSVRYSSVGIMLV